MCRTITGDSSRQDLASLGKVVLQQLNVFEIDQVDLVDTKPANATTMNAPSTGAAAHWATILIVITVVTATTAALAVFIIG
jgi:hypothetical protein